MTYHLAISVAAASRILLHRAFFDLGNKGTALAQLLKSGHVVDDDWRGFGISANGTVSISIPDDRVDATLLIATDAFAGIQQDDDILRVADRALRVFVTVTRGSTLNKSWHAFKTSSLLSVFANPSRENEHRRICFDLSEMAEHNAVALYAVRPLDQVENLAENPPSSKQVSALHVLAPQLSAHFRAARLIPAATGVRVIQDYQTATEYRQTVASNIALGRTFDEWLPKLDSSQREFVESTVAGPARLHGAAGTGKTLTLLMKVLHLLRTATDKVSIGLFAHSGTMRESVEGALDVLDPCGEIRQTSTARLEVNTLFEWCLDYLGTELKPGQLLDQEATESREFQREILASCVEATYSAEWRGHRPHCSHEFRKLIEEERGKPWLLTLLQHEIGCVLKGNRIQPFRLPAYLALVRPAHALPLVSEGDRRFVFSTYRAYEEELKEFGVFDVDDVTVEVLGRLESPLWSRQRQANGFDIIAIDEAHLLNDNERSLVRYLLRDAFGLPRLAMALDLLQSIGDTGVREDSKGRLVTPTTTTESTRAELSEVHRSSREILDLAHSVVSVGSELYDKPPLFTADSGKRLGVKPVLFSFPTLVAQVEAAFKIADTWRRNEGWRKHEIALICATANGLDATIEYARATNKPIRVVDRRGDQQASADSLRFSSYIVVNPEFSAGLQFKGIVLLDVSDGRVPDTGSSVAGARAAMLRRAVSEVYLALSRAQERVAILVDETAGPSELLLPAIEANILEAQVFEG